MTQFAVVQEAYEKLEPERLAPVLEETLGLVRFDAMRQAREGRGILAERLDAGQAESFVKALAAAGIEARRVPQGRMIRIGKPMAAREIRIADDALHILIGYTGEAVSVPWPNVLFLSAGEIVEMSVHRVVQRQKKKRGNVGLLLRAAAGDPFAAFKLLRSDKGGKKIEKVHRTQMNVHLADIFATTAGGEYLHVRLRSRDLYYDKILGGETTANFLDNFKLVLAKLGLKAQQAFVAPGLRALVFGDQDPEIDLEEANFGEEIEFTHYNRWQLQMLVLSAAQDAGGG